MTCKIIEQLRELKNADEITGLEDKPQAWRPPTHNQKVPSTLINLAQQKPEALDTRSSCGRWSACKWPSKNSRASTYPA